MKKLVAIAICAICISAPVQAGKKAGTTLPMSEIPNSQVADLTAQECRNLGGTVKTDKVCSAGKTCKIENANGDTHTVCLEVAQ